MSSTYELIRSKLELEKNSRLNLFDTYNRYSKNETAVIATKKYGLPPAQMCLAFVNSKLFVTSNSIGATNLLQLEENIDYALSLNLQEGN